MNTTKIKTLILSANYILNQPRRTNLRKTFCGVSYHKMIENQNTIKKIKDHPLLCNISTFNPCTKTTTNKTYKYATEILLYGNRALKPLCWEHGHLLTILRGY